VLTGTARDFFAERPLYDQQGHPIAVNDWEFTGAAALDRKLSRAKKALAAADRLVSSLPVRGARAGLVQKVQERRRLLDQALGYVELYGAYGRCEALYGISRLLELWTGLTADDQAGFGFDPRVIDWPTYITDVHLPTVVVQARVKTEPDRRTGPSRSTRLRNSALHADRHFAAFDLENTLIASNVVESYAWLATRRLNARDRARFAVQTLIEAPSLWARDRQDRTDFLRYFYRRYEGAPIDQLDADAVELFSRLILTKAFPAGLRRVREHHRAGHRTVLITGALDLVVKPLRPLFDDVIAAEMTSEDGRWTGELINVPPTGEVRAQVMLDWAAEHGFDPGQGVAYADAASDLPMLEAVGYPVAANPEPRLMAIADKRGWLIENWTPSPGTPKPLLPMAPPTPKELSR
jgi:HAD superfamily hydrolase (TIGR01490 family)